MQSSSACCPSVLLPPLSTYWKYLLIKCWGGWLNTQSKWNREETKTFVLSQTCKVAPPVVQHYCLPPLSINWKYESSNVWFIWTQIIKFNVHCGAILYVYVWPLVRSAAERGRGNRGRRSRGKFHASMRGHLVPWSENNANHLIPWCWFCYSWMPRCAAISYLGQKITPTRGSWGRCWFWKLGY